MPMGIIRQFGRPKGATWVASALILTIVICLGTAPKTVAQSCLGCSMPPPTECGMQGGTQTCENGSWVCTYSPIVIDVRDTGFHLTDAANGVNFTTLPGHGKVRTSWTDPKYGNGFWR